MGSLYSLSLFPSLGLSDFRSSTIVGFRRTDVSSSIVAVRSRTDLGGEGSVGLGSLVVSSSVKWKMKGRTNDEEGKKKSSRSSWPLIFPFRIQVQVVRMPGFFKVMTLLHHMSKLLVLLAAFNLRGAVCKTSMQQSFHFVSSADCCFHLNRLSQISSVAD